MKALLFGSPLQTFAFAEHFRCRGSHWGDRGLPDGGGTIRPSADRDALALLSEQGTGSMSRVKLFGVQFGEVGADTPPHATE